MRRPLVSSLLAVSLGVPASAQAPAAVETMPSVGAVSAASMATALLQDEEKRPSFDRALAALYARIFELQDEVRKSRLELDAAERELKDAVWSLRSRFTRESKFEDSELTAMGERKLANDLYIKDAERLAAETGLDYGKAHSLLRELGKLSYSARDHRSRLQALNQDLLEARSMLQEFLQVLRDRR